MVETGGIDLRIDHVTPAECRQLLEEAWRRVAPKKLVKWVDEE